MRVLALLLIAANVSGCVSVSWPPARGGGMAETAPAERRAVVLAAADSVETDLLLHLETLEVDLADAISRGAMTYVPAETTLARLLRARIRREIAGTLYSDAAQDLIELAERIDMIDRALADPTIRDGEAAI